MRISVMQATIASFCYFLIVSCSKENGIVREVTTKSLVITLTGNMDNIAPYSYFSIYSDDHTSFKVIHANDTVTSVNGLYTSTKNDFYQGLITFKKSGTYKLSDDYFVLTYLKMTSSPNSSDSLTINLKAYRNENLYKQDTKKIWPYNIGDKPDSDKHIFRFIF